MKKIDLTISEFDNFRKLARKYTIMFLYTVVHGHIIVEADSNQLESLGY